jgi:hypothetical protein
VPHDSGTALLTTGMHVMDPFSKKRRSPLEPVLRRTLIVLRGLSVSRWVPMLLGAYQYLASFLD